MGKIEYQEQGEPKDYLQTLAKECQHNSIQRFIRENFGLYNPPADYAALRRENMKRSLAAANRASFDPA